MIRESPKPDPLEHLTHLIEEFRFDETRLLLEWSFLFFFGKNYFLGRSCPTAREQTFGSPNFYPGWIIEP